MNAQEYQTSGEGASFMCAGGRHERCPGSMVDPLWKRWACTCECHELVPADGEEGVELTCDTARTEKW